MSFNELTKSFHRSSSIPSAHTKKPSSKLPPSPSLSVPPLSTSPNYTNVSTTEKAKEKLLNILENEVTQAVQAQKELIRSSFFPTLLQRFDIWITLIHLIFCIATIITTTWLVHLTDVFILAFLILGNLFFIYHDLLAPSSFVHRKAQSLLTLIQKTDLHPRKDLVIPNLPTVSMHTVYRDQAWHKYPSILLVENDLIELRFGELAPADCEYIFEAPSLNLTSVPTLMLKAGESFRPSFFQSFSSLSTHHGTEPCSLEKKELLSHPTGAFHFKLMASPLHSHLKQTFTMHHPRSSRFPWLHFQSFFNCLLILLYSLSLFLHLLSHFLWFSMPHFWISLFKSIQPLLPIVPLTLPLSFLLFRVISNTYLQCLWNALQVSKTMYTMDDDQFDVEAAPPIKDIHVSFRSLLHQFSFLNTSNLTETLGRLTVMCFVDREGTLVEPYPSITRVYLPGGIELDLTDTGYFEDPSWDQYLPLLKPLGFACLSQCPVHSNVKLSSVHPWIRFSMANETCLCPFPIRIGFSSWVQHMKKNERDGRMQSFTKVQFMLFAPYLAEQKRTSNTLFEIPFLTLLPWTSLTPSSSLSSTTSTSQQHAFVSGHPELVIPLCMDAWQGQDLLNLSDALKEDMQDWYSIAWMNDQQVMAFAYVPLCSPMPTPLISSTTSSSSSASSPLISTSFTSTPSLAKNPPKASSFSSIVSYSSSTPLSRAAPIQSSTSSKSISTPVFPISSGVTPQVFFQYFPSSHPSPPLSSLPTSAPSTSPSFPLLDLFSIPNYVFLGMLAFEQVPKPDVCDVIEDIGLAGIRFVYFSPTNERQTKAFGERLGLDTDWNACILLSEPGDPNASLGYVELTDIKAQLPRGLSEIQLHLQNVDDIPLHVSLFAESNALTSSGMMHLFQTHQDVVCCLGSTLDLRHTIPFTQADITIGMHPIPVTSHLLQLASECLSLTCTLQMYHDTSLYALIQLIREARSSCWSGQQALVFWWSTLFAFSLYMWVIHLCYLSLPMLPFPSYIAFALYYIQLPLLSSTFLMTENDPNTMKQFTERSLFRHLPKQIKYLCLRWGVPVSVTIYLHVHFMYHFYQWLPFQSYSSLSLTSSNLPMWTVPLLVWTVWIVFLLLGSSTFLHRTQPLLTCSPFRNRVWFFCSVMILLVQVLFILLLLPWSIWATLPWPIYTVFFLSLPIQLYIHEKVKSFDQKQWIRFQKRSKLEFNTRLGMHSPV